MGRLSRRIIMVSGFFLGFVSFLSLVTLFQKMPAPIKRWCAKHSLFTDILTTLATYATLAGISSSITTAFAAAFVGLFFEMFMYVERNPEDFSWLTDFKESINLHIRDLQNKLKEMNASYKANRLQQYGQEQRQASF